MTDNPLLQIPDTKNHAPRFDLVRNEHFMPAIKEGISRAKEKIETIKNNPETPDFENTIVALETSSEELGMASSVFYNMLATIGGDELHALAQETGPVISSFSSDVYLDEDLFARVDAVRTKREELDLTPEQETLLEETWQGFVRAGAGLEEKKKSRLREISQELSKLSPAFMDNAKKSLESFELVIEDEKDLSGLPESAIEAAAHAAQEKGYEGKWLITLEMPSYTPFIQYADNRDLRHKVWLARTNTAFGDAFDNTGNIKRVIELRAERARLLGYETHADYVLERRMAESADTVFAFIEKFKNAYKPAAEEDLEALKKFAKETDGLEDLKPWDVAYYSEKLKEKRFDFSSEDFRPYLPLENVLKGCFAHFTRLFNIRFEPSDVYPLWHEDVKAFDVYSNEDDAFVGTLYGDFYPRKGKKDGAWKSAFRNQGLFQGKVERPIVSIVCNFTKPTKDKPSLLTHNEVTVLFHEMGHAIHALLSDVTYPSLAGTSVKWDFVELPSQLQENWCYEKETLDLFAAHYESGEKIPGELIDKLVASKNFMIGMFGLRQCSLAYLDMIYHTTPPEEITDIAKFEEDVTRDFALFPRLGGPISTSFFHIFAGGYAAGYYSYKWAEVLEADTFEAFKHHGLYDQAIARAYRHEILEKGGSQNPNILYHNFRGRDADLDALLRREGLLKEKSKAA